MPVRYFSDDGKFQVDFTVDSNQGLFEAIANFQEIFEERHVMIDDIMVSDADIRFRVRGSGANKFYEKIYIGTDPKLQGYRLDYFNGDNDKLFPKRKDKDGNWLKNNGWYRYDAVPSDSVEKPIKEQKPNKQPSKNVPY